MSTLHDRTFAELTPRQLYGILRLRSAVFVVEQAAAYLDPDGRDEEPTARQLWLEDDRGEVIATARVLDDGAVRRIGRIATRADHRGRGLAGQLVEHFLATTPAPWRLDAQAHLAGWYGSFGFEVDGPEYDDDGIAHVPMVRPR